MKNVWIFCFILLCSGVLFAQDRVEYNYNNYSEMRNELGALFEQKRFEEAAKMLEWALPEYPDHFNPNIYNPGWTRISRFRKNSMH